MVTGINDSSIKLVKPKKKINTSLFYSLFFWVGFVLILVYFYYKLPLQNLGITTLQTFSIKEIVTSIITKNFANLLGICSSSLIFFSTLILNSNLANILGLIGVIMMFISSLSVTILHAQEDRLIDQYQKVLDAGIAKKEVPEIKQPHTIQVIQPISKKEDKKEESPIEISRYVDVKKQLEADKRKEDKIKKELEERKKQEEKKIIKELEEE